MKLFTRYGRLRHLPLVLFLFAAFPNACTDAVSRERYQAPPLPAILLDPHIQALIAEYDRFFSDSMRTSKTPGAAVVIVKDSVVLFERGYGLKSTVSGDSVDINTLFRIGSLSKGFAGVLTGIMVQEGKLHWEDPIVRYVPEFVLSSPEQTQQVQLVHLLSHTSGLPYHAYTDMIESGYDMRTIATYFSRLPLFGKPGEMFSYQNAAFSLVGEAMEAVTQEKYAQLIAEKIFRPAGMHHASADWESIHNYPNTALPHNRTSIGWIPDTITTRFFNAAPAGGVNASIDDMGQWLKLLLGQRPDLVSAETLDRVFHPMVRTYNERRRFRAWDGEKEAYYALGWRVLVNGADTIVCHSGSVNGYRGEIALDRQKGIAICVLFNASTELAPLCIPTFFEKYRALVEGRKTSGPSGPAAGL